MAKTKYFSYVGSYDGAIQIKGQWTRVKNLNYIIKDGETWERHQGPPTNKIQDALNQKIAWEARDLFPHLKTK